jgi:hypothetical protein
MKFNLRNITTVNLVELLARNTIKLTHFILARRLGEEYEDCKDTVRDIQDELNSRETRQKDTRSNPDNPRGNS